MGDLYIYGQTEEALPLPEAIERLVTYIERRERDEAMIVTNRLCVMPLQDPHRWQIIIGRFGGTIVEDYTYAGVLAKARAVIDEAECEH